MNNFNIANCSDTGRVRQVNEDSMSTFDSPNGRVVVVCDGMGGQNAGDVASQLAVSVIQDILTDNTFTSPAEAITRSVLAANQAILNRAASNPSLSGMGATCVILIIKDDKVWYGSVGDSRIYYISGGSITQVTRDQSYVQQLVDSGEISATEAEHHQDKNQITNALGIEGMTPPVLCQVPVTPAAGSIFLLCSDGLSNMLSPEDIFNIAARDTVPLHQRADALVEAANVAGGTDNITVQLIEFPQGGAFSAGGEVPSNQNVMAQEIKRNRTLSYILGALTILVLVVGGIVWVTIGREPDPKPDTTRKPVQTTSTSVQKEPETIKVVKKVVVQETDREVAPAMPAKSKKGNNSKEVLKGQQSRSADKLIKNATPPPVTPTEPETEIRKNDYSKDKKDK